jgi:hypothetical protein
LGGGVGSNLTPAIKRYQESIESTLRKVPEILPAALGDYSGAAGAVVAGLQTAYGDLGLREEDLTDLPAVGELTAATIAAAKPAPVAEVEDRARAAVAWARDDLEASGAPLALYDKEQGRAYLLGPDGTRDHDL